MTPRSPSETDDGPGAPAEAVFIATLAARLGESNDIWFHDAPHGKPRLISSHDFVADGAVHDILCLDSDQAGTRGGWSPAFLNWDDGVPAIEAGINLDPPDGILLPNTRTTPAGLAQHAAA